MNQRISVILIIALLISGAATLIVYRVIKSRAGQTTATGDIVVAARTLDIGTLVKDADLKVAPWVGAVPAGMSTKKDGLIGRGVMASIYEGEPIMENRLAPIGGGAGLAATIPQGKRAVAVKVDEVVGVAGFVVPGMRVDVLISGNPPGQTGNNPEVKTLLQNVEVLSAGQNYQKDAEGKPVVVPVVNLLVTPVDAESLSLASKETRIQLVLRNPLDTDAAKVSGTQVANLFGAPAKSQAPPPPPRVRTAVLRKPEPIAEKPAPPPPPYQIEVLNGKDRSEVKFARPPEAKQP